MRAERRRWTAEDYDVIEALAPHGLTAEEIGRYLDPPADGGRVRDACRHAGIRIGRRRGRPSLDEQLEWQRLRADLLGPEAADEEAREQITAFAAARGYLVQITRMPPEISAPAVSKPEVSANYAPGGTASIAPGGDS